MNSSIKIRNGVWYADISYRDPITNIRKRTQRSLNLPAIYGGRRINVKRAEEKANQIALSLRDLEKKPRVSLDSPSITSDIDFADYIQLVMNTKVGRRKTTQDSYITRSQAAIKYFTAHPVTLGNLRKRHCKDFVNYLLTEGKLLHSGERVGLSPRTVSDYKQIIYTVCEEALDDELIDFNPCEGVKVTGAKTKLTDLLFLEKEEIDGMILFLKNHPRYSFLLPIVFFAVYYGMRREEIIGLKWQNIDFEKRTFTIRHTVTGSGKPIMADLTKTANGVRTLPLSDQAIECLAYVKASQEANKAIMGNEWRNTDGYVFTLADGRLIRPEHATNCFGKVMREFGRPEISLHKLRHTFTSHAIAAGWDLKRIQAFIGDKDPETVMGVYAHFTRNQLSESSTDVHETVLTPMSNLFCIENESVSQKCEPNQKSDKKRENSVAAEFPQTLENTRFSA